MELRQLTYFQAVAEELHFGRAAERLHISQPPLSVQIRKLEAELATPLLVRSTRRVELTAAGTELRDRLAEVLPLLDEAVTGLDAVSEGDRGHLTIGFVSSASYRLLPAAVRRFREVRPRVDLRPIPLTTAEQLERVQEGTLHIALVRDAPRESPFELTDLLSERLVACLPAGHPLRDRGTVAPEELAPLPLIGYPRHLMPGFVDLTYRLFGNARHRPRRAHTVIHQETALGFVAAGEGISILPESVEDQLPPSVVTVAIDSPLRSRTSAATASGSAAPAASVLVEALRAVAADMVYADPSLRGEPASPTPAR